MSRKLSLKLFGRFEVLEPDGLALPTRKAEALLAYLALPAGRARARGELTDLLWGSRDERHARHSLNQALSSLRKQLNPLFPELICADSNGLTLSPDLVTSDVARLDALLLEATLEALTEAAELWKGDLLSGMELREEAFEAWRGEERQRLKFSMMEGFHGLLDRQIEAVERSAASQTARSILRLDPLDESAHRKLMQIYASSGQRNAALKQFRECSELLRRELDVAPDNETRTLHQQILRNESPTAVHAVVPEAAPQIALGEAQPTSSWTPVARSRPPAVSVRRFTYIGSDPLDQAVAESIGIDLLTDLTRDRSLAIVSDQSQAAGQGEAVYVVEGSLRRMGEAVAITAHLLDIGGGSYLWTERWVQPLAELLQGTGRTVDRLAAVLKREVETAEARKAIDSPPEALGAWSYYHLGLRELYRFTLPSLMTARSHFQRAIALDKDLAAAYARLAYVYVQLYWYGPPAGRQGFVDEGLAAAQQAVGLDPKEAHGHFALGRLYAIQQAFDQAVPEFEIALTLDPSLAQASFGLGQALSAAGLPKDAMSFLDQAIELDPQDPHLWTFYHDRAEALFAQGDVDAATKNSKAAVRLPNASHFAWASLVAIQGSRHKHEEAQSALRRLLQLKPEYSVSFAREELTHHANRDFVDNYLDGLSAAGLDEE